MRVNDPRRVKQRLVIAAVAVVTGLGLWLAIAGAWPDGLVGRILVFVLVPCLAIAIHDRWLDHRLAKLPPPPISNA